MRHEILGPLAQLWQALPVALGYFLAGFVIAAIAMAVVRFILWLGGIL